MERRVATCASREVGPHERQAWLELPDGQHVELGAGSARQLAFSADEALYVLTAAMR
ncbi:MAG: hypothetical protein AB7N76_13470 [Planctomycetota bacterium]